jgi:hypothetical protein
MTADQVEHRKAGLIRDDRLAVYQARAGFEFCDRQNNEWEAVGEIVPFARQQPCPATIGLVAIAFAASSKGYQVIAALLAAAVWLLIAVDCLSGLGHENRRIAVWSECSDWW